MSGRGRGRGGRWSGRFNKKNQPNTSQSIKDVGSSKPATTVVRTKLADYVYYIGSAKQASDYTVITAYILNHIRQNFEYGDDITKALKDRTNFDFTVIKPAMVQSTDTDAAVAALENENNKIIFEHEAKAFVARRNRYESNKGKAFCRHMGAMQQSTAEQARISNWMDRNGWRSYSPPKCNRRACYDIPGIPV